MAEDSSSKDSNSNLREFDYAAFGRMLSSDPKMIELASMFYSPRELVDIIYLCAQHNAGPEQVKKREEEFDLMLERKAKEKYDEALRKSKGRLKMGEAQDYKDWQISSYKVDIAKEILQNRKKVLNKIYEKKVEIENEIKRLKTLLEKMDDEQGEAPKAV